ncbi:unnamed protein product [Staurois parvus]|uniref:Uncharacterized protein n=1 Tax=Staurois parvus TaxID=386267 RepID=A0ABN9G549_9NEOB|nr:unnamed protein product [Staurois parvus]
MSLLAVETPVFYTQVSPLAAGLCKITAEKYTVSCLHSKTHTAHTIKIKHS